MAPRTPTAIPLAEAAELTSTGDLWLFRGKSPADRAIRLFTNSPVNHVAVALTLDDLPPLLWHAELGMSTEDVWAGEPQRGAQLHRLTEAVHTWVDKYGQRPYFRQLDTVVTTEMEDQFLRVVNEYDGHRFPRTGPPRPALALGPHPPQRPPGGRLLRRAGRPHLPAHGPARVRAPAQLVRPRHASGRGDRLELSPGAVLGEELEVLV